MLAMPEPGLMDALTQWLLTPSLACRIRTCCGLVMFAAAWTRYMGHLWPPGYARFLAVLPATLALYVVPLLFSHVHEPLSLIAATYMSARLPATKVVAYCFGRGLLAQYEAGASWHQWLALVLSPLSVGKPHLSSASTNVQPHQPSQSITADLTFKVAGDSSGKGTLSSTATWHSRANTWASMMGKAGCLTLVCYLGPALISPLSSTLGEACSPSSATAPTAAAATAAWGCGVGAWLLHTLQRALLAVGMYCAMAGLLDLCLLSAWGLCPNNLQLTAPFKAPWKATSLAGFWCRWNIPQSELLRHLVYEPMLEGSLVRQPHTTSSLQQTYSTPQHSVPQPACEAEPAAGGAAAGTDGAGDSGRGIRRRHSKAAKAAALLATFTFSGAEHVLFYWYITRTFFWPWLLFFSGHGVLLLLEDLCKRLVRGPAPEGHLKQAQHVAGDLALHTGPANLQQQQHEVSAGKPVCCEEVASVQHRKVCSDSGFELGVGTGIGCGDAGTMQGADQQQGCVLRSSTCHAWLHCSSETSLSTASTRTASSASTASLGEHSECSSTSKAAAACADAAPAHSTPGLTSLMSIPPSGKAGVQAGGAAVLVQWGMWLAGQPMVRRALTLAVLHLTACWGFYAALEEPQLLARLQAAVCNSAPQLQHMC